MLWLLTGDDREEMDDNIPLDLDDVAPEEITVPLVGFVSAGSQAVYLPLPNDELDRVPAPPGATPLTRSLEIRGDSLGELFDRWLVYYNDVRSPITTDLYGKLCVVGLADGRVMVKKVRRTREGLYDLISNNDDPIKNVVVEWAAQVTDMRPR